MVPAPIVGVNLSCKDLPLYDAVPVVASMGVSIPASMDAVLLVFIVPLSSTDKSVPGNPTLADFVTPSVPPCRAHPVFVGSEQTETPVPTPIVLDSTIHGLRN